ncbi:putative uncharacterized oxidoreductase [Daphnia sinensis]|uniref:Uncharacterized oxidoreductase n=1 Tax=Daphnia sinensis TaxID=1820382 RepID=A0AAD5KU89_9CRUS|nr:putative uncharacterized oxidoreductase [Daphnia sinensis]
MKDWGTDLWLPQTLAYLKNSFSKGAIGVKIWKNIGMELRDADGKFVMVNDARLDPVFDFIEKNNVTLVGHLEYPSYQDQIDARDKMLEKHPTIRFVGVHLGSLEWDVDELAKRLDKFPNMAVDMAERICHLQYQTIKNRQKVYDFMIKYQDRLIYATDNSVGKNSNPAEYKKRIQERRLSDWRYFVSDDVMNKSSLAGLGLAGATVFNGFASEEKKGPWIAKSSIQTFNMCGYAAPKLPTVRVGFIGLGQRGPSHLNAIAKIEGTEIKALCDLRPESVNKAKKIIDGTSHNPTIYTGGENEWKKLCERKDLDLIYVCTPWHLHVPMALYAMEQGKHVAIEVPAAVSMEECWQLVETSERTRKHCMMLENCCYDFFELLTLIWLAKVISEKLFIRKALIFII